MTGGHAPLVVRVVGIVRGRDIDATATATLDHEAVVLEWPDAAAWRLAFDGIDGVRATEQAATLYLRDHDVLELSGSDALRPFALALRDATCRIPELTRGLRYFGAVTRRAGTGTGTASAPQGVHDHVHDHWFAPLLAARKAVHGVSDPVRQVALLDGAALTESMLEAAARMAALLAPDSPAEQRALEAAIEDEAADLFAALHRLHLAGETVRTGEADTCCADWRRWVAAATDVFARADEAWSAIADTLTAP